LAVIAAVVLYFAAKWLFRWLLSRKPVPDGRKGTWVFLLKWILSLFRIRLVPGRERLSAVMAMYAALLRWGRFSGLLHGGWETPGEYGSRLGAQFPQAAADINRIIRLHDEAVYGGFSHNDREISQARTASWRIRRPSLWIARLKSFFFHKAS